jgi:signal transduction histidine kinase
LRIRHDPQRIGQVVSNLVGNAIKFTPRGGAVSVVVRPAADAMAGPDGAEIEVTDSGVGIDAEELPRIFDRFYRGTLANEARGSGSGLGLAIVRSIVEMHNGTVSVQSRLGSGSTFLVTLPRDPRREDATAIAPKGAPAKVALSHAASPVAPLGAADKMADSSPREAPHLNPRGSR